MIIRKTLHGMELSKDAIYYILSAHLNTCTPLVDISLVLECLLQVKEVQGSIPSQGQHHTKDIIKMVPVVHLFSTQH